MCLRARSSPAVSCLRGMPTHFRAGPMTPRSSPSTPFGVCGMGCRLSTTRSNRWVSRGHGWRARSMFWRSFMVRLSRAGARTAGRDGRGKSRAVLRDALACAPQPSGRHRRLAGAPRSGRSPLLLYCHANGMNLALEHDVLSIDDFVLELTRGARVARHSSLSRVPQRVRHGRGRSSGRVSRSDGRTRLLRIHRNRAQGSRKCSRFKFGLAFFDEFFLNRHSVGQASRRCVESSGRPA